MARLPTPGGDKGDWGDILNDFLATAHNADGTLKTGSVTPEKLSDAGLAGGPVLLDTNALLPESVLPGRLGATSLNNAYVRPWRASTTYTAGERVVSPDGIVVSARDNFTSGTAYEAVKWMYGTPAGSPPNIKPLGDGRTGVFEYVHDDTAGYIFHLLMGADSSAGSWIAGIGIDAGLGNGFIFRNKSKGIALKIEQTATISSATAVGLSVEQKSTVAPAVQMNQNAPTGATMPADLFQLLSFTNDPDDTTTMTKWTAYGKPAGEVRSTSGKLVWSQNIEVVGASVDIRDYNTVPIGDRYRTKVNPRNITMHSLSATGSWYGHRINSAGSQFTLQTAAASTNPDAATYTTLVNLRSLNGGELSFHGVTPVARQTVLAAATDTTTTMALVNDIRAKLIAKGLVI